MLGIFNAPKPVRPTTESTATAARMLEVDISTVRRYLREGHLIGRKRGLRGAEWMVYTWSIDELKKKMSDGWVEYE